MEKNLSINIIQIEKKEHDYKMKKQEELNEIQDKEQKMKDKKEKPTYDQLKATESKQF